MWLAIGKCILKNTSTMELIDGKKVSADIKREIAAEVEKMKEALGAISPATDDPTAGAGMSMDQLMEKLMAQDQAQKEMKKVIKIKKPVSPDGGQIIPPKSESTEE